MDNKLNSWLINDVWKLEYKLRIRFKKRENMEKVKKCPKSIGLETFLWRKKKQLTFLTVFYISYKNGIKTVLKWHLLT